MNGMGEACPIVPDLDLKEEEALYHYLREGGLCDPTVDANAARENPSQRDCEGCSRAALMEIMAADPWQIL